jgi:hypothetical protein
MVFQVYLEGENEERHVVLDIEYYLDQSYLTKQWISCIKVTNIVDGIARFVEKRMQENPKYNVLPFITDTKAMHDLKYWLIEHPDNRWDEMEWASPHHYQRIEHLRTTIRQYADKYGLVMNED